MHRVLLIEDDYEAISRIRDLVVDAGYEFQSARTGHDAVVVSQAFHPDIALIDVMLPDMSGVDVLRDMRTVMPWTACVMVNGCESPTALIECIRGGAFDWLQKPVSDQDLLSAITRVLDGWPRPDGRRVDLPACEPHAHMRLAHRAVEFIASRHDAPTLREFAQAVGISVGGFRNWCRTAGVRARAYLLFARALRAVYRREHNPSECLEDLLQIIDKRTIAKLAIAAGGTSADMPLTVDEFLRTQRLVGREAASAVRTALASTNHPIDPHRKLSEISERPRVPESLGHDRRRD